MNYTMIMVMPRFAVLCCFAIILTSCATKVSIPYNPMPISSHEEARKIIKQSFEEQPLNFRPLEINVGDDAIRLRLSSTKKSFLAGGITTVENRETYYYSSLAETTLISRRGRWQIFLSIRGGSVRRWLIFYDEAKAKKFLDALNRMQQDAQ
jgi:hypothetical protein